MNAEVQALITYYAKIWRTLLQYDDGTLPMPFGSPATHTIEYKAAVDEINVLKKSLVETSWAPALFAQEREDEFKHIVRTIEKYSVKSTEEEVAQMFYMIIKNMSFLIGNKCIASFMFIR